jgi:hypothetical protein
MNQVLAMLDRTSPAPVTAAARSLAALLGVGVGECTPEDAPAALSAGLSAVVIAGCGPSALSRAAMMSVPVLVVPETCQPAARIQRILVPLEGSDLTSAAAGPLIESAPQAGVEVIVVHAIDPLTIPGYTDQPQHEQTVWGQEFLARHCPPGVDVVHFETRVGPAEEVIAATALERGCDAIVLSWAKSTDPARAAVVRATLDRSRHPVLLLPISEESASG